MRATSVAILAAMAGAFLMTGAYAEETLLRLKPKIATALFTPRPMPQDNNFYRIKECTGNTFQCRVGVSTWCCDNGKRCDYDVGGCK